MSHKLNFGDKNQSKTAKTANAEIYSALTLRINRESITKCTQNVHSKPRHKQRDGYTTDWWLQEQMNGLGFSVWLTVSVLVLQDIIKMKYLG